MKKQQKKTRRRSNPVKPVAVKAVAKKAHGRRRRNPSVRNALAKPIDMMKVGVSAAGGLLGTRVIPQIVLGAKNTGPIGYGANFVTAIGLAALAARYLGQAAGKAVLSGGSLYIFNRLLNDMTPLGKSLNLSGIGDPQAAGRLGALVPAYFPMPVVSDRAGRPVIPAAIKQEIQAAIPAPKPAAAAVSGVGRFAGRF